MKKSILFFLLIYFSLQCFSKNDSCFVTINLLNKDSFDVFYIQKGKDLIYYDTVGLSTNLILEEAIEPQISFATINNDIDHAKVFYFHSGHFTINVDVKSRKFNFENSPLNNEKNDLDKIEDSIRESYKIPTYGILAKLIIAGANIDSISKREDLYSKAKNKIYYSYFMKNHQSFLALEFIKVRLMSHSISKQKLKKIFNKLPNSLKNYPSYNECIKLFQLKEKMPKETAKPLWDGK